MVACENCGRTVHIENKDLGLCATCNKYLRSFDDLYPAVRDAFIKSCIKNELTCPRCGKPVDETFTVHHKAGRQGYADKWAEEMEIPLLLDVRWFLAIDLECHQYIEIHSELAKKRGWSVTRLGIKKSPIPEDELNEIKDTFIKNKQANGR